MVCVLDFLPKRHLGKVETDHVVDSQILKSAKINLFSVEIHLLDTRSLEGFLKYSKTRLSPQDVW